MVCAATVVRRKRGLVRDVVLRGCPARSCGATDAVFKGIFRVRDRHGLLQKHRDVWRRASGRFLDVVDGSKFYRATGTSSCSSGGACGFESCSQFGFEEDL